jgi:hypothetical protein
MNHENLEKIISNKAQVKIVTYLGASIFLIEGTRSLLAGSMSAPTEESILAAGVGHCKTSNRRPKTSFAATKSGEQRGT